MVFAKTGYEVCAVDGCREMVDLAKENIVKKDPAQYLVL